MTHDELLRAYSTIAQREERARRRKALAIIKRAQREGLQIKAAVVDDVRLEFGAPEPAAKAPDDEVEAWIARHAH